MKVNIEGLLKNAAKSVKGIYGSSLIDLLENIRELSERRQRSDGEKALQEFFEIYIFSNKEAPRLRPNTVSEKAE